MDMNRGGVWQADKEWHDGSSSPLLSKNWHQNDAPFTSIVSSPYRHASIKKSLQPTHDCVGATTFFLNAAGTLPPVGASRTFSDNNTAQFVTIDMALAADGAAVARGMAETARIRRQQRLRDLLSAVEEWRRADGPDRRWWRQDALWRLQEWRRLYRIPERRAFDAAVRRARAA